MRGMASVGGGGDAEQAGFGAEDEAAGVPHPRRCSSFADTSLACGAAPCA